MKSHVIAIAALAFAASLAPASAEDTSRLRQVAPHELDHFIGSTMKGKAYANVGIVSAVSKKDGSVAVVGRHGELATVDMRALARDGWELRAPTISVADIARASNSGRNDIPIGRGTVEVIGSAQRPGGPAQR